MHPLATRIYNFLKRSGPGTLVTRDRIWDEAKRAGYTNAVIRTALDQLKTVSTIGIFFHGREYFVWYALSDEEQERMRKANEWFDAL